jgi:hypothetical protein
LKEVDRNWIHNSLFKDLDKMMRGRLLARGASKAALEGLDTAGLKSLMANYGECIDTSDGASLVAPGVVLDGPDGV